MGETDLTEADIVNRTLRNAFALFDRPAYWLLGISYELFFNVATSTIISPNTITKFYSRVQLIIGVYMLFQLALLIIRGIVNPDDFTKAGGTTSKFIVRVVTVLFLFSTLVPMGGINPKNEFETQIKSNGILFGTLYSLQKRLLESNTLGRLILGTNDDTGDYWGGNDENKNSLKKAANIFTTTILKGFYRVNLVPEDQRVANDGNHTDDYYTENRICRNSGSDKIIKEYKKIDADPQLIISMVDSYCDTGNFFERLPFINLFTGKKRFVFSYMPIVSAIVAIVFVFILGSFTVDVAVRAIKLSILRLIAPIPLVSYLDPNSSKDSGFNAWVKTLTSTYVDLFVRLSVVYFVIFLIQEIIAHGLAIKTNGGIIGVISTIIIFIGLFIFAKQAPKFLRQAVGAKDGNFRLFGGLADIIGTVGAIGATTAGTIGSFNANRQASRSADEANGRNPNSFLNRGKHLLAGIAGGFGGARAGASAAWNAKDHSGRAAMDAIQKRNADVIARGSSGSTLRGRLGSTLSQVFTGEGSSARLEREITNLQSRQKALDAIKSRVSGEMVKQDWTTGEGGRGFTGQDSRGSRVSMDGLRFNYKNFLASMEQAKASGSSTVTVTDSSNHTYQIDYKDAELMKGNILKNNEDDYIQKARADTTVTTAGRTYNVGQDKELVSLINDAMAKGGSGWNGTTYSERTHNPIASRDDYTKTSEGLGQDIRDRTRANVVNKANDRYSGKK